MFAFPVCVYSLHACVVQGQSKWRCIISNHSERGHCSSLARQSDHLRGFLVYGLWPKAACLSLYVSLSLYPLMPLFNNIQKPQQPWPSPLISSLLALLSTTPASCPLPPWGEKGQGHEDKHRKVKVEERERQRELK